jgi:Zn-dependent peptidase ImmA (M78 family)
MRRGPAEEFLLECELIALEKRRELGLGAEDPLDPRALAADLAIEVVSIARFRDEHAGDVRLLTKFDTEAFSAATVFCGPRCVIIYNPAHTEQEINRSIAHELGHILLEHRPRWPIFDERTGERMGDPCKEAEADYLAGALLVPEVTVRRLLELERWPAGLAAPFGVTEEVLVARLEAYRDGRSAVGAAVAFGAGGEPVRPREVELSVLEEILAQQRRDEGPSV